MRPAGSYFIIQRYRLPVSLSMVCTKMKGRPSFSSLLSQTFVFTTPSQQVNWEAIHFLHYFLEMYTLTKLFITSLCACVAVYLPIHNRSKNDRKPGFVICQLAERNRRRELLSMYSRVGARPSHCICRVMVRKLYLYSEK